MRFIRLCAWNTRETLFSGHFKDWKTCLEAAIGSGVDLNYLVIEDADIGPANLDGGIFDYARFLRCNLRGANLSECSLVKTQFIQCTLNDVCLADSVASGARFLDSSMRHCDVDFADLRRALVGCTDFLKTDFSRVRDLSGAAFSFKGHLCPMTHNPVFVRGLGLDVVLLDEHVVWGGLVLRKDQLGVSAHSMAGIFAQHGLTPPLHVVQRLWELIRGEKTQFSPLAA